MTTASYVGEEHEVDWIGFVESDEEYAGRCSCGWRTTGPDEPTVDRDLQSHVDDWDGGPDAE